MDLRSGKRTRDWGFLPEDSSFEPTGPSLIETVLSDDVLMLVFQQLERQTDWEALSLVSKRWSRLAAGACTKLRVTRSAGGQRMTQVLRRFGPGLQTLDLGSAPFVENPDLRMLPWLCPNLTSLTLNWQDSFSDAGLCEFAEASGTRLLELSLSRCQGISFRGIADACQFLPNLRFLDISHVLGKAKVAVIQQSAIAAFHVQSRSLDSEEEIGGVNGPEERGGDADDDDYTASNLRILEILKDEVPNLERMAESRRRRANGGDWGDGLQDLGDVDSAVASIAQSCRGLQTLLLKDCCPVPPLSDKGLAGLASGYCATSLTSLDLSFCDNITDEGLRDLAEKCTNLQELGLACISGSQKVTSSGLGHVLRRCPELTALDLSGNTLGRNWFRQLGTPARNLVRLNLNRCRSEPDQPYLLVWKMCLGGPAKFSLTHLNLMECHELEDLGLSMVAVSCVALKVLKVSGCTEVTDRGLTELGKYRGEKMEELVLMGAGVGASGLASFESGAPWPKLHTLAVSQCDRVGDKALQSIALHCRALKFLEAGDCFGVGSSGFSQILQNCTTLEKLMLYQNPSIRILSPGTTCPRLRELDVSGSSLKSEHLRTLADRCPNLENVDISGNKRLEGTGLQGLVGGCARLAILDIQDCPKVTDKALGLSVQASSSLRKVFVTRTKLSQRLEDLGKKKGCKVVCC